jgi:hypothetical protein
MKARVRFSLWKWGGIAFFALVGVSCATYYQKNIVFSDHYYNGNFAAAEKVLESNKKGQKPKNRLLYLLNKGVVEQQLGEYHASNNSFEEAYRFIENSRKNIGLEALSLVSNSTVKPYVGEDFEVVLLHYYKALNFIFLRQYEAALVECRRMNIRLNELNDKYKNKNRYSRDAFIQNLMGIIYEASGDDNNAFIAYRNAFETYQEDYLRHFGIGPPEQLKQDLMRTAYTSGMRAELERYEEQFKKQYVQEKQKGEGSLVCFWNNGLGPVKAEWSINFTVVKGQGGYVTFVNDELGLNFPFFIGGGGDGNSSLSDLKFVRVAFPKYTERRHVLNKAEVVANGKTSSFEMAEDINAIAFKTLQDRMIRELSNSLLRLALKQAAEELARKENEAIGAAVSLFNAITEKADTRNWQTLPYHISYTRLHLPAGDHQVEFTGYSGAARNYSAKRTISVKKDGTAFELFTTIR